MIKISNSYLYILPKMLLLKCTLLCISLCFLLNVSENWLGYFSMEFYLYFIIIASYLNNDRWTTSFNCSFFKSFEVAITANNLNPRAIIVPKKTLEEMKNYTVVILLKVKYFCGYTSSLLVASTECERK